jgi:hypothetical protein
MLSVPQEAKVTKGTPGPPAHKVLKALKVTPAQSVLRGHAERWAPSGLKAREETRDRRATLVPKELQDHRVRSG